MIESITLENPIIRGLACVALHEGLRSVLLIDANPAQVGWCSTLLAQMVAAVHGSIPVAPITLASTATDDLLWGVPFIPDTHGQLRFFQRGLLSSTAQSAQLGIITSADLSQLSLAAQRAAVIYIAAPVVHLERHGQQRRWQPQHCWLAGCAQQQMGKVSPHLLDRFLLRLTLAGQTISTEDEHIDQLWRALANGAKTPREEAIGSLPLPTDIVEVLQAAKERNPAFSITMTHRVLTYIEHTSLYFSPRRDIALARLAVVHAMLAGHDEVEDRDIDDAAEVMGYRQKLKPAAPSEQRPTEVRNEDVTRQPALVDRSLTDLAPPMIVDNQHKSLTEAVTPVYSPDTQQTLPAAPLLMPTAEPYGEDHLPPEREAASLRVPLRHPGRPAAQRGVIVGVGPATALHDLALVSTLLEAAKFQTVRRQTAHTNHTHLLLRASDLRSYRRLPTPESLLVLVIDYTALRHCDWEMALLPHLEWAYTTRAGVALIQVGAANATHEFKADAILARSLLDPRIGNALMAPPGRATPLAHGLDLAQQMLRHALQHGRTTALQARLVVLTDGRGNLPLAASYAGVITHPINREGIDDALRIAAEIRRLERVTIVCLDPQPAQHGELPQLLAEALGVIAQSIEPSVQATSSTQGLLLEVQNGN